jgi:uncharacterized protein YciI
MQFNNHHWKGKVMTQLACVLLSVLVMTGNFLTSGFAPDQGNDSPEPFAGTPQDQSAVNMFAASLTKYYVGIVNSGPEWTEAVDELAKQNRAYIGELVKAGKLVGAGQVMDSKDVRWVLFFKGDSLNEAKTIIAEAPAVKANRFIGVVRQTWGTRGIGSKMSEVGKMEAMTSGPKVTHFIAVFKKGSKWSPEENESSRKLLQNHITNVVKLHQEGALKFYGAFDDQGEVRSFAILQAKSLKAAKELLKSDPLAKANWATLDYFTFEVAEGILP